MSRSATAASTITRLQAVQRWPVVPKADQTIPSTARSRSASASTTIAFLPPSSRATRLSRRPARSAIRFPVAVEPVNEMTGDVGRIDDRVADLRAAPGHEVHDARREAGLGHQLDEERGAVRACRRPA